MHLTWMKLFAVLVVGALLIAALLLTNQVLRRGNLRSLVAAFLASSAVTGSYANADVSWYQGLCRMWAWPYEQPELKTKEELLSVESLRSNPNAVADYLKYAMSSDRRSHAQKIAAESLKIAPEELCKFCGVVLSLLCVRRRTPMSASLMVQMGMASALGFCFWEDLDRIMQAKEVAYVDPFTAERTVLFDADEYVVLLICERTPFFYTHIYLSLGWILALSCLLTRRGLGGRVLGVLLLGVSVILSSTVHGLNNYLILHPFGGLSLEKVRYIGALVVILALSFFVRSRPVTTK